MCAQFAVYYSALLVLWSVARQYDRSNHSFVGTRRDGVAGVG